MIILHYPEKLYCHIEIMIIFRRMNIFEYFRVMLGTCPDSVMESIEQKEKKRKSKSEQKSI